MKYVTWIRPVGEIKLTMSHLGTLGRGKDRGLVDAFASLLTYGPFFWSSSSVLSKAAETGFLLPER
jgi:hypothetical protein